MKYLRELFLTGSIFFLTASASLFVPLSLQAQEADRVGVGVGTGKIIIEDRLQPGARYEIAPLSVINTGNVSAEYEVLLTYHEQQKEFRPDLSWFAFTPNNFILEPGEVKVVAISLLLPLDAEPGDYFAYLEAHPLRSVKDGSTSIGVAAAAKLYFEVEPANIFQAVYYRVRSWYFEYQLASNIAGVAAVVFVLILIVRRFVSFDIKLKPKTDPSDHPHHPV